MKILADDAMDIDGRLTTLDYLLLALTFLVIVLAIAAIKHWVLL